MKALKRLGSLRFQLTQPSASDSARKLSRRFGSSILSFTNSHPPRRSGTGPLPHPASLTIVTYGRPGGGAGRCRSWRQPTSNLPLGLELLDLGDRARRAQPLGAGVGAVHDRVAAIEAERVFQLIEPLAGIFVAAVGEPAIGLEQDRGAKERKSTRLNSSH